MSILEISGIIIGSIISLGALIAGAGYGFGKFYEGKNKRVLDETTLFNEQLEALKKIIEEQKESAKIVTQKRDAEMAVLREDIKKHTEEIGKLKGINEEKEKKIKELMDILANRDPALKEYMEFARSAIVGFQESVREIKEVLLINKNQ